MPIYEYDCAKCGAHFEVLIRSDRDLPGKCPQCGKGKPVKAFSAFAVAASSKQGAHAFCESCPSAEDKCPSESCAARGCPLTR
jgi:putative FmdB family regulatory protein